MKKIIAGAFAGLALSVSMSVSMSASADFQDIPETALNQFKQEVQEQSDIVSLSKEQSETLLDLKIELYRHNRNLEAVHGDDQHTMSVLSRANQSRYDAGFAELMTDKQKEAFQTHERNELRKQVPADFMNRYEKQIADKGKVMKLSKETKAELLELKMTLYTQQQAANRQHAGDNKARNAARRANRGAYNAQFEQLTTRKQRDAWQKWRKAQRNA